MVGDPSGAVGRHLRTLFSVGAVGALTDRHLLDLFASRREEAAFATLVERHGPMVQQVCRQVLGDPHDAQDASQAVFLVLAKRAGSIRRRNSVGSWLHGVAIRVAAKARVAAARRRAHERRGGEMRARRVDDRGGPEAGPWPELHEELDRLPEKFRAPIVLCHLEGLSREVAAQQLGWPVGTVQSRLARGRERLRARLARRGVTLSAGLLGTALAPESASAGMTAAWAQTTVRAAMRVAAGEAVAVVASAQVATITRGALQAMFLTKVKAGLAIALIGGAATGAATLALQMPDEAQGGREIGGARPGVATSAPPPTRLQTRADARVGAPLPPGSPTPALPSLEDRLEAAMRALQGRATGPTWRPTGGGAGDVGPATAGDAPAEGRIIDLQGRPVAGARVWVLAVKRPDGADLSPFLAAIRSARRGNDLWSAWHGLADAPPGVPPRPAGGIEEAPLAITMPATSDADGRFRVEGVDRERAILALIEGPTIEARPAIILTRPGATLQVQGRDGFGGIAVYGASFDHIAAPSRAIEGIVRDRETREPLPGVSVRSASTLNFTGLIGYIRSTSDDHGHYRLVGIAEGMRDRVTAVPPDDRPYFSSSDHVEAGRGEGSATLDLPLKKGLWVRGRVTDRATGAPLAAEVEYHAFQDNPHLGANPRHEMRGRWTGGGGAYRVLALPGRGLVAAKTHDPRYVRGVGLDAIFKGRSEQDIRNATYPFFGNVGDVNTVAEIDLAEGAEKATCNLALEIGKTRTGTVLGPDGKPLDGFVASELTPGQYLNSPSPSAQFAVNSLVPGKSRRLVFRHDARRLIGTLVVSGDGSDPLTVTLGPWATVTGRVLDDDGEPRSDISILLFHGDYPSHAKGWAREPSRFELGKDGRFRMEALAPGVAYDLEILSKIGIVGHVAKGLVVKSGESKDLGDLKVIDTTQ